MSVISYLLLISRVPSPGIELTLFGYVTGSNQRLYPQYHVSLITVYSGERNKGLNSTFQPPEEGRSVKRPKRFDKHGDKDEDNSPKNENNVKQFYFKEFNLALVICLLSV